MVAHCWSFFHVFFFILIFVVLFVFSGSCLGRREMVTFITKTCLYNVHPLKPHFYTAKLEFTGVNIIFLISAKKNLNLGTR